MATERVIELLEQATGHLTQVLALTEVNSKRSSIEFLPQEVSEDWEGFKQSILQLMEAEVPIPWRIMRLALRVVDERKLMEQDYTHDYHELAALMEHSADELGIDLPTTCGQSAKIIHCSQAGGISHDDTSHRRALAST